MATLPPYATTGMNPAGGTGAYNLNPSPQSGSGPWGSVPGAVGMPDPFSNLSAVYPNLGRTNTVLNENILSNLVGEQSPSTIAAIHDAASRFGLQQPLNLSNESLGTTDQELQDLGLSQFNRTLPTISATQTVSPQAQAQIAEFNSQNQAAPDKGAQEGIQTAIQIIGLVAALA